MVKDDGVDSRRSWVIASASAVINFLILAPARLSGQLFVFFMEKYDIDREAASFPFTICFILRTLSGPLAGFLAEAFGLQKLSVIGCVLSTIGVGLCFISEEIISVTIFLGVIYGLGYGFVCSLVPQFLNLYFEQHLSKANGIAMGGACLGAFLLPPLIQYSAHHYGVSGMMLIFSGLVLHSVPASMMLVRPNFSKIKNTEDSKQDFDSRNLTTDSSKTEKCASTGDISCSIYRVSNESSEDTTGTLNKLNSAQNLSTVEYYEKIGFTTTDSSKTENSVSAREISCSRNQVSNESSEDITGTLNKLNSAQNLSPVEYYEKVGFTTTDSSKTENSVSAMEISCSRNQVPIESSADITSTLNKIKAIQSLNTAEYYGKMGFSNPSFIDDSCETDNNKNLDGNTFNKALPLLTSLNIIKPNISLDELYDNGKSKSTKEINGEGKDFTAVPLVKFKKKKAACGSFSVFLDPVFILISIVQSSYFFTMFIVWTVIVDFVRDKNIDDNEDMYFIMCLSVSDLFGRVGLGFVTDGGYMTKMNFCAASFFLMGTASWLLPFTSGFELTFTVVFLYGFISGGIMIVFPGMVMQFISEEKRTMAMASRTILNAPMSVTISPLIGFFRENHGSYDGIFYLVTILSLICAGVSLFIPCLASCQDKKKSSREKLSCCQTTTKGKEKNCV